MHFVQSVQLYHLKTHWLTSIGPIFRLSLWFYEAPLPNNPLQSPTQKCNIQGFKLVSCLNHTYTNNIYENTLLNRINAEQPNLLSAKNNFSLFKITSNQSILGPVLILVILLILLIELITCNNTHRNKGHCNQYQMLATLWRHQDFDRYLFSDP